MQDLILRAGGAAGDGIATVGETFCRLFTRQGYYAFGHNGYQSVIRGGHVWFQARGSAERIWSQGDGCDILYALNLQTAEIHAPSLRPGGILLYDPEKFSFPAEKLPVGTQAFPVPTLVISRKFASEPILQNAVGMGAVAALAGQPLAQLQGILTDSLGRKKGILEQNLQACEAGFRYATEHASPHARALPSKGGARKVLISGNQAIAMGAVAAGCKFLSQYPMTPASSIMHWLASHAVKYGVVVKQVEDELAAINMAIGASHAGVRAMTATSGGGFSLMVEGFGMAGMTETPLVVVESQRSGPSTGLPTKTEQGDLQMIVGASQGEFPRVVLAPGGVSEAYRQTAEAFALAEEWQTPVVVASDLYLSEDLQGVDREEFPSLPKPPSLFTVPEPPDGSNGYQRYLDTPSGVSPRAIPGQAGLMYDASSDEHDEYGHLISDVQAGIPHFVELRERMMRKRMRKLEGIRRATAPPTLEGPAEAELTLVGWGSSALPIRDALGLLGAQGVPVNYLHIAQPWPLHGEEIARVVRAARRTLLVEQNFSGQLGKLIRAETGVTFSDTLLKYDGEPFYPWEIMAKVLEVTGRVHR